MSDQQQQQQQPNANTCMCGGKGPALSQMIQLMLPPEAASEHFRNAGIELLKGFRELIDQRIDTLSRKPATAASGRGVKLDVE